MTLSPARMAALIFFSVTMLFTQSAFADTKYVRVAWDSDPATRAIVGYTPDAELSNPYITYGHNADGSDWMTLANPVERVFKTDLHSGFYRLSGLTPDSNVYFRLCDDAGCGDRYFFRTAPDSAQPMTFISGGDSRNNRAPRQQGNRLVAKIRPHFVAFSGDYTDRHTVQEWNEWLTDWELTLSPTDIDGVAYKQVYPIIPTTGNHESSDLLFMCRIFGIDIEENGVCSLRDAYYAFNIGGDMLRLYSLSTEFTGSSYANERAAQLAWLKDDLATHHQNASWIMAQYHIPMFPRTASKSGSPVSRAWSEIFYDYRVNLVVESDTHLVKYTLPVRPNGPMDYIQAEAGIVYIGEGAWGAPLRTANVHHDWILDQGSFSHFMVNQIDADKITVRTARFDGEADTAMLEHSVREADPFALPAGLSLWDAAGVGHAMTITRQDTTQRSQVLDVDYDIPEPEPDHYTVVELVRKGSVWKYLDNGSDQGMDWIAPDFDDSSWAGGAAPLGYGGYDGETTTVGFGPDDRNKYPTTYFRHTFEVDDISEFYGVDLGIMRDDGAVVYLNGEEVFRNNMPSGEIDYQTLAASTINKDYTYHTTRLDPALLNEGVNVLAVSIHQDRVTSSDIVLDLEMVGKIELKNVREEELISRGSVWKYLDNGSDQGWAWTELGFDDVDWSAGPALLGYGGYDGETTIVGFGPDSSNKYPTTYFRRTFNVEDTTGLIRLDLSLLRDDGAVVYLNGDEIYRNNMPDGIIDYLTLAASTIGKDYNYHTASIDPALLRQGENVVAVSIHQDRVSSSDIVMDMDLIALFEDFGDEEEGPGTTPPGSGNGGNSSSGGAAGLFAGLFLLMLSLGRRRRA
ncbi:purple acid phosphatase family protein [Isoalcanivorax indicus]|uniref:purple acid phosphatase family protein n=1 Tax=Isoalcanivorax indicus TaxID=2202653 RepID=UPI000DBACB40|nr:metallophosphoesterase family protein [Isoalcanivorax indicus]